MIIKEKEINTAKILSFRRPSMLRMEWFGEFLKKIKAVQTGAEKDFAGQMKTLYPVLKPGDWIGIRAGAVRQTLFGSTEKPQLVIALGYGEPSDLAFVMPADLEGKDANALWQDAYRNLESYPQDFEWSPEYEGKILSASGQGFSSEKILCINHMMKAHELLNSNELFVSIPRRSFMLITSRHADENLLNHFLGLHNHTWRNRQDKNQYLLNALVVVIDGQIDGFLSLEKKPSEKNFFFWKKK